MSTLFISDLHLSEERPDIIRLFIEFMNGRARDSEALYILGDLFEVWLGDDYISSGLQPVIDTLKDFSHSGHNLYIQHGNRDFLLGESFAASTGAWLLPDPSVIDLNGIRTLISHGDELCTDDVDYMAFRRQVRNADWQRAFLAKPIEERMRIAQNARQESKTQTRQKTPEIMDVNQDAVQALMRAHDVQQMIHGHTHRPNTHHFEANHLPMTRIVLGDWYDQGSVLDCGRQGCELQVLPLTATTSI